MNYIIISVILFSIIIFVVGEQKRPLLNRKFLYFAYALILSLIFSLRDVTKTADTAEYVSIFIRANISQGLFTRIERYEPGYCAFNRLIKLATNDYRVLFFLISIITYVLFYRFIRKEINGFNISSNCMTENTDLPLTFLLLYTSYYGLLYNSIVMRACIAICLIYLSASCFQEKRNFWGVVLIVIAISFHQTAVLALPILLIYLFDFRIKKRTAMIITITLLFLYIIGIANITTKFVSNVVSYLYTRFPNSSLLWWSSLSITGKSTLNSEISLYRLYSFILLLILMIQNDGDDYVDKNVTIAIIGMGILTLFGNLELMIRLAEYYMIATIFACYKYVSILESSINLLKFKNVTFIVNKTFFIIIISIIYYIVFLRNVIYV